MFFESILGGNGAVAYRDLSSLMNEEHGQPRALVAALFNIQIIPTGGLVEMVTLSDKSSFVHGALEGRSIVDRSID